MKIGDYEQMMSYLTRKSFKEGTPDTSKPKPKPLTEDFFKEQADLYIKGLIGGFPQDEMFLKLQGILDKAVEQGLVKPEEGVDYFRNRKQELLDFAKENPGETLPSLGREGFKEGTDYNRNPKGLNQYGPMRSLEEVQNSIDNAPTILKKNKQVEMNPKDLQGRSEYNNIKQGGTRYITRPEYERYKDQLNFKTTGKAVLEDPRKENIRRSEKIKKTQGANISVKGSGQTGKQFSHVYPLIESAKPGTKTTGTIDAKMNRDLQGYNKIGQEIAEQQELLIKTKPENYKQEIVKLNAQAKKNVMNAVENLGKEYKGQIGYFQVDPETGEFKPKAGNYKMSFAGIEGENKIYKDMTGKERKDFEKKISAIEKAKAIPGVTTADKIERPQSALDRESFKNFEKRISPKLKGVLIPGIEEIVEGIKNIPDDIKKRKYFALGLKGLGVAATPLIAAGMYNDLSSGKSVVETLERNLIGTDIVGATKDVFALSPQEREARSIVKQDEMAQQVAQDFSGLDTDLQSPQVKSKMTLEEAGDKYEKGMSRVKAERASQEADIARARSINMQALKDLITGKRFQPQEVPQQFMANGGRIGFADGFDPKRRKFMKAAAGIASIPVFGKFLKPVSKGIESIGPAVMEAAKGMPEWFSGLVSKVFKEGIDVTKQFGKEGEQVFVKQLGEAEGVRVTKNLETGKIKVDYDSPTNMGEDTVSFTYRPGTRTEKGENIPAQFEAVELEPRGIRMGPDDYDIEFDGENLVEDAGELMSDTSSLKQFAVGKLDDVDLKLRQEKLKKVKDLNENQTSQAEYLENKYGAGDPDAYKQFPNDD